MISRWSRESKGGGGRSRRGARGRRGETPGPVGAVAIGTGLARRPAGGARVGLGVLARGVVAAAAQRVDVVAGEDAVGPHGGRAGGGVGLAEAVAGHAAEAGLLVARAPDLVELPGMARRAAAERQAGGEGGSGDARHEGGAAGDGEGQARGPQGDARAPDGPRRRAPFPGIAELGNLVSSDEIRGKKGRGRGRGRLAPADCLLPTADCGCGRRPRWVLVRRGVSGRQVAQSLAIGAEFLAAPRWTRRREAGRSGLPPEEL